MCLPQFHSCNTIRVAAQWNVLIVTLKWKLLLRPNGETRLKDPHLNTPPPHQAPQRQNMLFLSSRDNWNSHDAWESVSNCIVFVNVVSTHQIYSHTDKMSIRSWLHEGDCNPQLHVLHVVKCTSVHRPEVRNPNIDESIKRQLQNSCVIKYPI